MAETKLAAVVRVVGIGGGQSLSNLERLAAIINNKDRPVQLVFAGKVGTGFTTKLLVVLHKKFRGEERADCPFVDLPSKQNGQWVQGITPSLMRRMHWIKPVFVCEIKFAEWTRDGKLRAPVFLGLREDKKPSDVMREAVSLES